MDLRILLNEFLDYLEIKRDVSMLTIRNYRHYLNRFLGFLATQTPYPTGFKASKQLKETRITSETIGQYRLYLSRYIDQHGISLKRITQNYHLIAIRTFLKYMQERNIPALAPQSIDLQKTESRSIRFLERTDVERLLNMPDISTVDGLRDKVILEFLFATGLRVSELVALNRKQFSVDRRELEIIGKGGKTRIVFLTESARIWLKRYLAKRTDSVQALFIRYSGKRPESGIGYDESLRLTARSVQRLVEKYVKKARFPTKITPQGLRHSLATDLILNGTDVQAIAEILGHKNISTTQMYTHLTRSKTKSIHEKFHHQP